MSKNIRLYKTPGGKEPFAQWLKKIKDPITYARILRRIDRLELGNYGDYKSLGDGIYELRLAFGSGYRVYFAEEGDVTILLLVGGDKSSQSKDIKKAREYWQEFKGKMA